MLLGATVVTSCSVDEIPIPSEELYMREFIKEFGVIASDHDWNLAQHSSVTVQTAAPTHVKIIAEVNGKRYLFADYHAVEGTKEIPVTIPKGVTNVIVRTPSRDITTTLGSTVDLRSQASRIVWEHDNEDGYFNVTTTENRIFRTPEEVLRYREKLPEGTHNIGEVTEDFMFVSKGPFIIYPAYYMTNRYLSNIIGIYHYDDDMNIVTQDFFRLGDGKLMTYTTEEEPKLGSCTLWPWQLGNTINAPSGATKYEDFTDEDWSEICRQIRNGEIYFENNDFKIFSDFNVEVQDNGNAVISGLYRTYKAVYGQASNGSIPESAVELCFQGIRVDIPEGQKFGMYIKLKDKLGDPSWGIDPEHKYFFSESHLNTDYAWLPNEDSDINSKDDATTQNSTYYGVNHETPKHAVHAATFTRDDGFIRLCFEDWYNNSQGDGFDSDFDLNDMVFYITGELGSEDNPTVTPKDDPEDPEPYMWIIAAEDLGGSYDWDFNDLVVGITTLPCMWDGIGKDISEYTEVTIHPLASGGTMPIYLMYTGLTCTSKEDAETATEQTYVVGQELHSWFNHPTTKAVNVGATAGTSHTGAVTFLVPGEFTLANTHNQHYNGSNMGGFWVLVDKDGSNVSLSGEGPLHPMTTIPEGQGITTVTAPDPSKGATAPQMICVESHWLWPREFTDIRKAYPKDAGRHGFEGWVDHTVTDGSWYGEGKHESRFVTAR